MVNTARKYHQAAIVYLIYGIIYLVGALHLASVGAGPRGGAFWFILGGLMALIFPLLVWKGFKWFTRILAVFVAVRVLGLIRIVLDTTGEGVLMPWGGTFPVRLGAVLFLIIAGAACFMLIRAGWDVGLRKEERLEIDRR
mgnify:CR=1 FL=1